MMDELVIRIEIGEVVEHDQCVEQRDARHQQNLRRSGDHCEHLRKNDP